MSTTTRQTPSETAPEKVPARKLRLSAARLRGALKLCGCVVLLALFAADAGARQTPAKENMTDEERALSWKGEKVALVGEAGDKMYAYRVGNPKERLASDDYRGKTGTVVDVKVERRSYGTEIDEILVEMDGTGEKIIVKSDEYLGFLSEKKTWDAFVGKTWWTKGRLKLYNPGSHVDDFSVGPATKVTVTKVDWDQPKFPFALHLTTEEGREGVLHYLYAGGRFRRDRHYNKDTREDPWAVAKYFYEEDPKKTFPEWNADIWKLIRGGLVSIGMSEKMIEVTCGRHLRPVGGVISGTGSVGVMYDCYGKRFLIDGGKVSKYVE